MLCKECYDKIDWDYRGSIAFQCEKCEKKGMATSNLKPRVCTNCSEEEDICMICWRKADLDTNYIEWNK